MEYMLDSLNIDAIKKWNRILPLAGVTSTPSIAKIEGGISFFGRIRQECGEQTYIKVPITEEGLAAVKMLKTKGYFVTATAIYTSFQGLLAIEAGADYLAPYFNRMENLNINPAEVIAQLSQVIQREKRECNILAANFKNLTQVTKAIESGSQAVTVSPDIFESGFAMPSVQKAVDDFEREWESIRYII